MYPILANKPHPLHDVPATRRIESYASSKLAPHTLMQSAGSATARLARAVAPHARVVWIACGPGNNGGDGLEAATQLKIAGLRAVATWMGNENSCSADTLWALHRARNTGVEFSSDAPPDMTGNDLCIDALLGIGLTHGPDSSASFGRFFAQLRNSPAPTLALDIASGLNADTGNFAINLTARKTDEKRARTDFYAQFTLSLLTLKPGLFTASGRDASGQIWFDDLGVDNSVEAPTCWLSGPPALEPRAHYSHKGNYGDVAVVGGESLSRRGMGMSGAPLLAASAALHGGAGRVLVSLLDHNPQSIYDSQPELMFRQFDALRLHTLVIVCGCGGGEAIGDVLASVLQQSKKLVLDADALNAIANNGAFQSMLVARRATGLVTVLTPHPLEAARLLGTNTKAIQAHRLLAAQRMADVFHCVVALKGSGTVIAMPGRVPAVNPTGNARLATAGTGDVLAGMIGAALASGIGAFKATSEAVYRHGLMADLWPSVPLVASALAKQALMR